MTVTDENVTVWDCSLIEIDIFHDGHREARWVDPESPYVAVSDDLQMYLWRLPWKLQLVKTVRQETGETFHIYKRIDGSER